MTDRIETLKALVEQCRAEERHLKAQDFLRSALIYHDIADELEALIAAGLSEPEPPQSQLTPTTMCPDGDLHVLRCIRCELPAAGLSEAPAPQDKITTTLIDDEYKAALKWRTLWLDAEPENQPPALDPQIVAYLVADAEELRRLAALASPVPPKEPTDA